MDINPMMLLPLIMGNKEGGDGNLQKMMSMITGMQSGNPNALLDMLGGDNEKIKNIMNVMKTLQNGQPDGANADTPTVNGAKTDPEALKNDEITRALSLLMRQKTT